MERLEQKRRLINDRLDRQRERINARFDEEEAKLAGKLHGKRDDIIAAALELLKAQGLNDLSLRDIAKALHMQAPALYWYFSSKDELIDYMAEAILQEEFGEPDVRPGGQTWQDWFLERMIRLRKAMLAYPDGGRVVAGAHLVPAITLAKLHETAFMSLTSDGVEGRTARHVITTATNFTFGCVIEEQSAPTDEELADIDTKELKKTLPSLASILDNAMKEGFDTDRDYRIGLEYIIRGAEVA
jgi:TetR/AcrR family tetracycline transcriptional repressor